MQVLMDITPRIFPARTHQMSMEPANRDRYRVHGAVNYVILVPALLFFISLGLPRRFERAVGYAMVGLGCLLAAATFLFGDSPHYERINSIAIISASGFFLIRFMASGSAESVAPEAADFGVIRWGLLIFVGLVVWQNSAQFFRHPN
jgi:hypothetical protein